MRSLSDAISTGATLVLMNNTFLLDVPHVDRDRMLSYAVVSASDLDRENPGNPGKIPANDASFALPEAPN